MKNFSNSSNDHDCHKPDDKKNRTQTGEWDTPDKNNDFLAEERMYFFIYIEDKENWFGYNCPESIPTAYEFIPTHL